MPKEPKDWKRIAYALTPPLVYDAIRHGRVRQARADLLFVPEGWTEADGRSGWDTEGVLDAYKRAWPVLAERAETSLPFDSFLVLAI